MFGFNKLFLLPLFCFLFLPGLIFAQGAQVVEVARDCQDYCDSLNTPSPKLLPSDTVCYCSPIAYTSITELIDSIIGFVLWVAIIVAPVMAIIAGLLFLTAGGNPNQVKKGNQILLWTIAGFLFILFSKGVLNLIQYVLGV